MAYPKNMEQVAQGGTITLDVYFYDYSGGILTDPDSSPTYVIKDPSGATVATGSGTKVEIGHYTASYEVSATATISAYWSIEWTAFINEIQVADASEYFGVVSSGSVSFNDVIISDANLSQIKKVIAYPSATRILLTDAQIKEYAIRQALDEYFRKFPLAEEETQTINKESIIDFADSSTFGVLDVRIVGKGYNSSSGSSFWDIVAYQSIGGGSLNRTSMYGAKMKGFNPNGLRQTRFMNRITNDSLVNEGTFKYRVDYENRKLYAYSSISATLNIKWAKYSYDFSKVRYQFKWDVIKLSQAFLLEHVASIVGIVTDSAQEVAFDIDSLKEKSKELLEEVREKWLEYPDTVILRQ